MNILTLVLALVLLLSILTIEKLNKFKNQTILQKQTQYIFRETEVVYRRKSVSNPFHFLLFFRGQFFER